VTSCPSCLAENSESATICAGCGASLVTPTHLVVSVDLSAGTVFHARYEILGPLGRGGMGMVYKAHDRTLDEIVAIKVLRPDFAQDPRMAERFKSEIKLARKVRHKNVCAIHDYGADQGLLYISMELVEGVDLKRILKEAGGLPHPEAYDLSIQIAEGLQAVHDAGIIHRDLKTPNIMRDARGVARLMDFGIAKRQGAESGTSTASGHIVGTPEYMSPEQAQGHRVDFRSDIYALGVVIYEIFTGHVPFRGDTPISTILKHLHDPPPLEGPEASPLPGDLVPVLRRALAKDPIERYGTASELAQALRDARSPSRRQQPVPTAALQAPTLPRAVHGRGTRRSRQRWALGASTLTIVAVLLAWPRTRTVETVSPPGAQAPETLPPTPALPLPPSTSLTVPETNPSPGGRAATAPATTLPRVRPSPGPRGAQRAAVRETTSPTFAPTPPAVTPPATVPDPGLPPLGLLQVAVRPWGEVSVDGKVVGTTPLDRISIAAGAHVVRVRHPSYEAVERSITVRAGEIAKLVVDLPSLAARKQP